MPLLDGDDRVVGYALSESRETGNYMRCYLVCDFASHKLRMYPEEAEFDLDLSKYTPFTEINTQYITKVSFSNFFTFEISTISAICCFSVFLIRHLSIQVGFSLSTAERCSTHHSGNPV